MTYPDDSWIDYPAPRASAVRMFCVPYAGGGPAVYRHWPAAIPGVELGAVRLPGRDRRIDERPHRSLPTMVGQLADALARHLDRPYALFGHSIGARIAFELARELRRRGRPGPLVLFASGSRPPHRSRWASLHDLDDESLCRWLVSTGGMSDWLLADAELRGTLLPVLRADLELEVGVMYADEPPLACPILAFGGADDPEAPPSFMDEWRRHTTAQFALRVLPGGHFFIRQHYRTILDEVSRHIQAARRSLPTPLA
jgi:medium-chain acyl-[acyl-carrier-protein] hydrolase